jgi:hypothetical protein
LISFFYHLLLLLLVSDISSILSRCLFPPQQASIAHTPTETISQRHAITLGEAKRRNTQLPPLLNAPSPSAPLPQIHQLYFGAFEVFAVDVIESKDGQTTNSIDIAFKTSDRFAGCYRLAVTQSQGGEMDTLSITTAVCNPEENRRPVQMGRGFYAFHVWYKDQLFRDAVSAVLRGWYQEDSWNAVGYEMWELNIPHLLDAPREFGECDSSHILLLPHLAGTLTEWRTIGEPISEGSLGPSLNGRLPINDAKGLAIQPNSFKYS